MQDFKGGHGMPCPYQRFTTTFITSLDKNLVMV